MTKDKVIEQMREALQDVMDWISNWNPNFESDDEWPESRDKAEAALAAAKAAEPQAKKDLMWSTVAMQERHDRRIENTVATLERIKQEQSARYQPVKESFWWRVRIGDGTQTIGRCYTETEAQRLAAELQRAFNDGAFCVEKVVCSGDLIGAAKAVEPKVKLIPTAQELGTPQPERKPLTVEAYTAIAHRTASKYAHRSDPAHIVYTFFPHTLDDFVRKIEAAHEITNGGQQ